MGIGNQQEVIRAAAILTLAEVNTAQFDLRRAQNNAVAVKVNYTAGDLDSCAFKFFAATEDDPTTFVPIHVGGIPSAGTGSDRWSPTANANRIFQFCLPGCRLFMMSAQGTDAGGSAANSSATITVLYNQEDGDT